MALPIEHLSASSINLFLRCPRQWQAKYIHGDRGEAGSALVIGKAVHLCLSRRLSNSDEAGWWEEAVEETARDGAIRWDDDPITSHGVAVTMIESYWEQIGRHLKVVKTEQEFNITIEGVGVPVIGFVDLETRNLIADYKTTRYFAPSRVKVNPEWKLQQGIYQLVVPKPGECHVLTRAKRNPIVVPTNGNHPLHFGLMDPEKTVKIVKDAWDRMNYYESKFGLDSPWEGSPTHEWAGRYCSLGKECCAL